MSSCGGECVLLQWHWCAWLSLHVQGHFIPELPRATWSRPILWSMKIEIDTMLALTQSVKESWINRWYATFKSYDCCAEVTIFHIHMQHDLRAQVTLNMCGYMLLHRLGSPSSALPLLYTSPTILWPNMSPTVATKRGAGVIPSPPAPYSKEPHKRPGFPAAMSRVSSCLLRSLCVHLYAPISFSVWGWNTQITRAQTSLFTETLQKSRSSFELWALKQHSKMSQQVGYTYVKNARMSTL